jgi:glucokinase
MKKTEKFAIGVDLGGTNIKIGVVTDSGKIAEKIVVDTNAELGPKAVIAQIKKGIEKVYPKKKSSIKGIGIGSPGVVSAEKGTVENPPNLPGWTKVNLRKVLEKEFNTNVFVENDANAAAIGELVFGAGKKLNSFLLVTLGTGVGCGIVFERKIFGGEHGGAGELGHTTIDHNGKKCNCGSVGCIEAYIGNNYLVCSVKEEIVNHKNSAIWNIIDNNLDLLTPKSICDAIALDDAYAKSIVADIGEKLGHSFASAANLLDISSVIIGGGVSGFGKPLFDAIAEAMKARVLKPLQSRVKILPAKLKNEAGIKGASALVFYK